MHSSGAARTQQRLIAKLWCDLVRLALKISSSSVRARLRASPRVPLSLGCLAPSTRMPNPTARPVASRYGSISACPRHDHKQETYPHKSGLTIEPRLHEIKLLFQHKFHAYNVIDVSSQRAVPNSHIKLVHTNCSMEYSNENSAKLQVLMKIHSGYCGIKTIQCIQHEI